MSQGNDLIIDKLGTARQLVRENKLDEARVIYEQLCVPGEERVDVWLELAVLYRKIRRYPKAQAICRQALSIWPDYALVHHINGSILQCLGNIDAAISSYKKALSIDGTLVEACYFLGNAQQQSGLPEHAVISYRKAVKLKPDFIEALSNLGAVLMALHQYDEAQTLLEKANRLYPGCQQVLCNLGDLSLVKGDLDRAVDYAGTVLKASPEFFDAHVLLGKVYRGKGDYGRALEHYGNARSIRPDNEDVKGSIAEILEIRGEFDEARTILGPLLDKGSTNPLVLRVYSALSRHYNEEGKAIGLLEKALQRDGMDLFQRIRLHSELGKQYDRLKKYKQAFRHYKQANEDEKRLNAGIKSRQGQAFPGKDTIGKWFRQFDVNYWKKLPRSGVSSSSPVFVVGMPRSGTTLAEQILASHPDVYGAGELPGIPGLVQQFKVSRPDQGYIRLLGQLTVQELKSAAEKYLVDSREGAGDALRVVDKMPTNFWHLGMISLLFPGARVIHMMRDPRDVCLSIYFQRFDASMTFTTDLEELAEYYMAYTRIVEYWHAVLDIEILDVEYEDLVADQENVIRDMIGFCGLGWDDRCLEFYRSDRDVHTPSYDQVRQPMYSSSVGRWKNYQQQLAPLTAISELGRQSDH